ncbi:MAG: alpha/beta hydrolase [Clostridia bacterium]|nr:alpha/beta hydrolase [Clostridia bacterium]
MRSFMSAFASGVLRITLHKQMLNNNCLFDKYMQYCAAVSAKPYKIAPIFPMKSQTKYYRFEDTDIVTLQAKHHKPKTLILYLHGGAYLEQPVPFQWSFIDHLVHDTDTLVVAPIYNKTPRHNYKEAHIMLTALYKKMLAHTSAENIIFFGDSSGGGLALAFAKSLLQTDLPQPKQILLFSPWLDISMENDDMDLYDRVDPSLGRKWLRQIALAWANKTDLHDPLLSPLFGSNVGLAKTALFVGDREILLPDARLYREKALADGVDFTYVEQSGVNHCYPFYPTPEAKQAKKYVNNFINTGRI